MWKLTGQRGFTILTLSLFCDSGSLLGLQFEEEEDACYSGICGQYTLEKGEKHDEEYIHR